MPRETDAPSLVPTNVPTDGTPENAKRAANPGGSDLKPSRDVRALTRDAKGWRFQIRLPRNLLPQAGLNGALSLSRIQPTIRARFRARSAREAGVIATRMTARCHEIFEAANARAAIMKAANQSDADFSALLDAVVEACKKGIENARAKPDTALAFANNLDGALETLKLVARESSKGASGIPGVRGLGVDLTRAAIGSVLAAGGIDEAERNRLLQGPMPVPEPISTSAPATASEPLPTNAPLFSKAADDYYRLRVGQAGGEAAAGGAVQTIKQRCAAFMDILGDRPIDQYKPSDIQDFVFKLGQVTPRMTRAFLNSGKSIDDLIAERDAEAKRRLAIAPTGSKLSPPKQAMAVELPLARKTIEEGYIATVRAVMNHATVNADVVTPFARLQGRLRYPAQARPKKTRVSLSSEVLNKAFVMGPGSGFLDLAMLPILGLLTSRRLGVLVYLRGTSFELRDGVWHARPEKVFSSGGRVIVAPTKTVESLPAFALHEFLVEIGFVDWARARGDGWVFEALHQYKDPAKSASKRINRFLRECGAAGDYAETFHSTRTAGITLMRKAKAPARVARLQAGHELGDEHDQYGGADLEPEEARVVAERNLPDMWDLSAFEGLDFDALAAKRPEKGRRRK